jgi:hypothetical protein
MMAVPIVSALANVRLRLFRFISGLPSEVMEMF